MPSFEIQTSDMNSYLCRLSLFDLRNNYPRGKGAESCDVGIEIQNAAGLVNAVFYTMAEWNLFKSQVEEMDKFLKGEK